MLTESRQHTMHAVRAASKDLLLLTPLGLLLRLRILRCAESRLVCCPRHCTPRPCQSQSLNLGAGSHVQV